MATVRDITTLCRAGKLAEAYELAKADLAMSPENVWGQREVAWALYYMLKDDSEKRRNQAFYEHLKELMELDLLTIEADSMIFDKVLWKLADVLKNTPDENIGEVDRLFPLFSKLHYNPSNGYSYLLKSVLGFATWPRLVAFFEWWNIDNLLVEDYQQFQMENGRKIMSLAEQAYIAYSKALLKLNDKDKIRAFLPKIEQLMDDYPEMMYPGYFCGKLMLAMGAERDDALETVMPFVRKKRSEFWVWQLLCDLYKGESDIQLACLLRAVHCRTQEVFLGKVRMKLVSLYINRGDYPRAKHHLDQVTRCYVQQGWRLPAEVQNWMRESWVHTTPADSSDGVDYQKYTNAILSQDAHESIAVVTYVDTARKRAFVVYGKELRTTVSFSDLQMRVKEGSLLKLKWTAGSNGSIDVVGVEPVTVSALKDLSYLRVLEGKAEKHGNHPFAFVRAHGISCYIHPDDVRKQALENGRSVSVLAVWDYNKKKDMWNWTCVSLKKIEK